MKRDMDLVRHILLVSEQSDGKVPIGKFVNDKWQEAMVGHHMVIISEAGLIDASIRAAGDNPYYYAVVNRLTWEGHDFLDAARSDTIWKKAKEAVKQFGGSVSFEVFKRILGDIASSAAEQLSQTAAF